MIHSPSNRYTLPTIVFRTAAHTYSTVMTIKLWSVYVIVWMHTTTCILSTWSKKYRLNAWWYVFDLCACVGLQVTRQMQTLSEELCACRKELQAQTTALKRATHDREELAKDKAALDVRLNSADRNACGLTQELVALRSECVCLCVCVYVCVFVYVVWPLKCFGTNVRFKTHFFQFVFCSLHSA